MDDMQTAEPNDVEPKMTDLTDRLETVDPAEAPPVAEQLADRLSEALDAAGGGERPDAEPSD